MNRKKRTNRKTAQNTAVSNLIQISGSSISKEEIADILKTTPEALAAFEDAYRYNVLDHVSDNFFEVNSRQAAQTRQDTQLQFSDEAEIAAKMLARSVVQELLAQTDTIIYDGSSTSLEARKALPGTAPPVTLENINALPGKLRPQLTGTLISTDMPAGDSSSALLWEYQASQTAKTPELRKQHYHLFRQGLDILDLDPLVYAMIDTNPNSISHWFPALTEACAKQSFFRIPKTIIAKVPLPILQLTRLPYESMSSTTMNIVNQWAHEIFQLNDKKEYFIKTGTYSSKFDFRNCHVHGEKEVQELGEYLLFIHFQALQMASPLSSPSIYGASTTTEWVVREFIHDKENCPCIYKGLPLHTEYRVFVDFDTDSVLRIVPYWEPETMKRRFNSSDNKHDIHDAIIYQTHEHTLMQRYEENKDLVSAQIHSILPDMTLMGQWSIDVMQNGDDFWIIDMALAETSAFYDRVPAELRHPATENWLPNLPAIQKPLTTKKETK